MKNKGIQKQSKEDALFLKRMEDLSEKSERTYSYVYSDFLNLNEQALFLDAIKEGFYAGYSFVGGHDSAERKIIRFEAKEVYDMPAEPIDCIKIQRANEKFGDKLTHRDYLGTILGLGIDRCKIGDILIDEDVAFVFVKKEICDFICSNLERVKHTSVKAGLVNFEEMNFKVKMQTVTGTVTSIRLDAIIALFAKISRSSASGYIAAGKVFVNGRLITSNSYSLKEQDIVSVRGIGRFVYSGVLGETRKERQRIQIEKYI
ncbi:MAG: RNA-binding protein [Lachnospiraceae bacterium]|nr:RNA-binding protein [Lachnospiraceae bacterium]